MNIQNIYNNIISVYERSGLKRKDLTDEILFFVSLKILNDKKNNIDFNKIGELKTQIIEKTILGNYFDINSILKIENEKIKYILETVEKNIIYNSDEELFENVSSLIDKIHSISNPKHAQFYTNKSMAKLTSELLLSNINIEEINKQEEISIYESSSGTGNLIFSAIDCMKEKGINISKLKVYANEYDSQVAFIFNLLLELKGIKNEIRIGDTLTNYFLNEEGNDFKKFDFVIGNPPFGLTYNQNEILNHSVFDLYKDKNKTTISKASDSLLVFLEIIRRSYTKSAAIIGSSVFNSFDKYFNLNDKEYSNSVLGNIVKEKQLEYVIDQDNSMFFNTDIKSTILKLSNNNEIINYVDISKSKLTISSSGQPKGSKIKKVYSEENIKKIINNPKKIKYNKNTDIKTEMNSSYEFDKDRIEQIVKGLSLNLLGIKLKQTLMLKSIENDYNYFECLFNHISNKTGVDSKDIKSFLTGNSNREEVIRYFKNKLSSISGVEFVEVEFNNSKDLYTIKVNDIVKEVFSPIAITDKEKEIIYIATLSKPKVTYVFE